MSYSIHLLVLLLVGLSAKVQGHIPHAIREMCNYNDPAILNTTDIFYIASVFGPFNERLGYEKQCYSDSHRALIQLLDIAGGNDQGTDCGYTMASRIAHFHQEFISFGHYHGADAIKAFFLRTSMNLARVCMSKVEQQLDKVLEWAKLSGEKIVQDISSLNNKFPGFYWKSRSKINTYNDFLFSWRHSMQISQLKGDLPSDRTVYGDRVALKSTVNLPDDIRETMSAVRYICYERLRLVYKDTLLPVMMMLEMGYADGEEVIKSDQIKKWYEITQVCELVMKYDDIPNHKTYGIPMISLPDRAVDELKISEVESSQSLESMQDIMYTRWAARRVVARSSV